MDQPILVTEAALADLEQELPALAKLRQFALSLDRVAWFGHVGEHLRAQERRQARLYLETLGFPEVDIAILVDWRDAVAAAETHDWATPAWEAEELTRADLTARAGDILSEEALQLGVAFVADKSVSAAGDCLDEATALWDTPLAEPERNLAIGSVVQTCHNAALALLVATSGDPESEAGMILFTRKLQLYRAGRWPVGVLGNSFNIF